MSSREVTVDMAVLKREEKRTRRKRGIRKRVRGTASKPRLTVFRSLKHIYVQAIDDQSGSILAHASSLEKDVLKLIEERASAIGEEEAQQAGQEGASEEVQPIETQAAAPEKDKKGKKAKKKGKKGGKAAMVAAPKVRRKTMRYRPGSPTGKILQAMVVGETVAQRLLDKGVSNVVFDRNGFRYHGRVAALADGARAKGLKF